MSETPATDSIIECQGTSTMVPTIEEHARSMEKQSNRWRSVAEQLEKFARTQKDFGPFKPLGEKHMIEGLAAFDSIKEVKNA